MSSYKKAFSGVTNKARFENAQQQSHVDSLAKNVAILTGQTKNKNDRAILYRDLLQLGLIKSNGRLNGGAFFGSNTDWDFGDGGDLPWNPRPETPDRPTGVSATPAFTTVMIKWDTPSYAGHGQAEIWRNTVNTLGNMDESQDGGEAVLVGTSSGALYVDNVNYDTQYYYWVRFVNDRGVVGPVHDVNGISANTFRSVKEQIDEVRQENEQALSQYQQQFNQKVSDLNSRADELFEELSKLDDVYVTDAYAEQYMYTRDQADQATAGQISAFQAQYVNPEFNSISSALSNRYTKSQANLATAGQISAFRANLLDENGSYANAFINRVNEVITNDNEAVAQQISNYSVSYGGNTYSIAEVVSVSVDVSGAFQSQWGIQSNVGNLKHGVGFWNDNGKTRFMVNADTFAVYNPSNNTWKNAFTVKDGKVYIDTAMISEAFVGDLAVELNAVFEGDVLVNTRLTAANIYGAKIKSDELWLANNGWSVALDPSGVYPVWFGSTSHYNPDAGVDNRSLNNASFVFRRDGVLQARGLRIINDNNQTIMNAASQLNGAYIMNASVDTLQIRGNAVTVPLYIETSWTPTQTGLQEVYDGYLDLETPSDATTMVSFSLHAMRGPDSSGSFDKIDINLAIFNWATNNQLLNANFDNVMADHDGDAGTVTHIVPVNGAARSGRYVRVRVQVTPTISSQSYRYKIIGFLTSAKR